MEPIVTLTNMQGESIGEMSKTNAHISPSLHLAFSVILYSEDRMLIQRRAQTKYHCPGLWANTCCSHPRPGRDILSEAEARLKEEAGIEGCALREAFTFTYFAEFAGGLCEYEYDHVMIGEYTGHGSPNPDEIESLEWISFADLLEDMRVNPRKYAPWFLICGPMAVKYVLEGETKQR